jgi:DNA-binding HxlR family transcriptional regulator
MRTGLDDDRSNCSISRSLDLLGEKWTFLIVREAWYGVGRFADFEQVLGCARNLLAERLRMLVAAGILATEPYREPGSRTRQRYLLTDKGKELLPVLVALREWGDRHLSGPEGPPVYLDHKDCGGRVSLELRCSEGHLVDGADALVAAAGPGLRLHRTAT